MAGKRGWTDGGAVTSESIDDLTFDRDGAQLFARAAVEGLDGLLVALSGLPSDRAGLRLLEARSLQPWLSTSGMIGSVAASMVGEAARPVRAVLFDKTAATNWSLAWHQDRTIVVRERIEVEGFGPWTCKNGILHVAPPYTVLEQMVTLRVHLDDVPPDNAPLLVAPGSHKLGRIPVEEIAAVVERCGQRTCVAHAGDVWLYATPIVHASRIAAAPSRRRVLQLDYAAHELPGGLQWSGIT